MLEVKTTHVRAEHYLGTHSSSGVKAGGLVGEALHIGQASNHSS